MKKWMIAVIAVLAVLALTIPAMAEETARPGITAPIVSAGASSR